MTVLYVNTMTALLFNPSSQDLTFAITYYDVFQAVVARRSPSHRANGRNIRCCHSIRGTVAHGTQAVSFKSYGSVAHTLEFSFYRRTPPSRHVGTRNPLCTPALLDYRTYHRVPEPHVWCAWYIHLGAVVLRRLHRQGTLAARKDRNQLHHGSAWPLFLLLPSLWGIHIWE